MPVALAHVDDLDFTAATTVSSRLGEWMEIGGLVQGVSNQQSAIPGSPREVAADNRRILLKVEAIR